MAFSRTKSSKFRERESRLGVKAAPSSNGEAAKVKSGTRRYLREYLRWLRPYWKSIAFLFVIASIYAVFDKVWPLAIKFAIDKLGDGKGMGAGEVWHRWREFSGL